ncbi:hypothetical protein [Kitasatospora sp. NPDC090091]|uniref:hypothetical protein n=1 Tax=Kitasatospora sp. NPDC090091 TaxID=3364081 RepID=UPI0037FF6C6E
MNPTRRLLVAVVTVPALSALAAALVCWPIRSGPLAPRLLIFGLVLSAGVIAGLPAVLARLTMAADRRNRTARARAGTQVTRSSDRAATGWSTRN